MNVLPTIYKTVPTFLIGPNQVRWDLFSLSPLWNDPFGSFSKYEAEGVPFMAQQLTNPTRIHEDVGLFDPWPPSVG